MLNLGGGGGARRASVNVEQRHDSDGSETRAEGRHGRLLVDHEDSLTEHKRTTLVPDDRCQVDSNVQVAFFFLVSEDVSGSAGSLQTGGWGVVGGGSFRLQT